MIAAVILRSPARLARGKWSLKTPFDEVIDHIIQQKYHNQRQDDHSNIVSSGIFNDLCERCDVLKSDIDSGEVRSWQNVPAPGARGRKIDLLIGPPNEVGKPDLSKIRIGVENKSVITAHRNRDARFDDLNETLQVIHRVNPEAVLVATAIVGITDKCLNVADRVKPFHKADFESCIRPRLSRGDGMLWKEFEVAVSKNKEGDPEKTVAKFRALPTRLPGHTHIVGYDYVLVIPVFIDNVNEPYVARLNDLKIDVDREYDIMINQICKAYRSRWHA